MNQLQSPKECSMLMRSALWEIELQMIVAPESIMTTASSSQNTKLTIPYAAAYALQPCGSCNVKYNDSSYAKLPSRVCRCVFLFPSTKTSADLPMSLSTPLPPLSRFFFCFSTRQDCTTFQTHPPDSSSSVHDPLKRLTTKMKVSK